MKKVHLINQLRYLAQMIECSDLPDDIEHFDVTLAFHRINNRRTLAAVAKLLPNPIASNNEGCYWVTGHQDQLKVNGFYEAGMLGPVNRCEINSDLEGLLREYDDENH